MIFFSVTKETTRIAGEEMKFSDKSKGSVWLETKLLLSGVISILFTYILRQFKNENTLRTHQDL